MINKIGGISFKGKEKTTITTITDKGLRSDLLLLSEIVGEDGKGNIMLNDVDSVAPDQILLRNGRVYWIDPDEGILKKLTGKVNFDEKTGIRTTTQVEHSVYKIGFLADIVNSAIKQIQEIIDVMLPKPPKGTSEVCGTIKLLTEQGLERVKKAKLPK